MKEFENMVAVITGASGGIGRALAEKFSNAGANIVLWDIVKPIEIAEKIKEQNNIIAEEVDITNAASIAEAAKRAINTFKKIDILINNAGITRDALILRMKEEYWDKVIEVNLKGAFLCSKIIGQVMWSQKMGRIVNIASVIGQIGNIGQANYSASKAGLIALTKTCAREFARANIRVNAVAPGYIQTPMTEKIPENIKNAILEKIPLGTFGTSYDVVEMVLFLASNRSSYITGQVFRVDGGLVM
ncbi:MAG TPA: 3-oxoacyl-[acyl-carrier-protein] reductase [bacterium]|nr:3-oxoacyl-[acyl-carrier-protein] reductase [bacterium]